MEKLKDIFKANGYLVLFSNNSNIKIPVFFVVPKYKQLFSVKDYVSLTLKFDVVYQFKWGSSSTYLRVHR